MQEALPTTEYVEIAGIWNKGKLGVFASGELQMCAL